MLLCNPRPRKYQEFLLPVCNLPVMCVAYQMVVIYWYIPYLEQVFVLTWSQLPGLYLTLLPGQLSQKTVCRATSMGIMCHVYTEQDCMICETQRKYMKRQIREETVTMQVIIDWRAVVFEQTFCQFRSSGAFVPNAPGVMVSGRQQAHLMFKYLLLAWRPTLLTIGQIIPGTVIWPLY